MTFVSGTYSNKIINSVTSLGSSDWGKMIQAQGSSAYTITLPSPTNMSGRFIDFSIETTSNAIVTLSPPSGTISGQSSILYGAKDGCRITTDGTNFFIVNEYLYPVGFRVTLSTDQTVTTSVVVTAFDTVERDLGSYFNTSTHIYTPLYPGRYVYSSSIQWTSGTAQILNSFIQMNGTSKTGTAITNGIGNYASNVDMVGEYMNGTTDNMSVSTQMQTANATVVSGNLHTYFRGYRQSSF